MSHDVATAYACVAYRIMKYEEEDMSEEYLGIMLETLYGFYTPKEIKKIYQTNIIFDSYEAVMKDNEIKQKTNE